MSRITRSFKIRSCLRSGIRIWANVASWASSISGRRSRPPPQTTTLSKLKNAQHTERCWKIKSPLSITCKNQNKEKTNNNILHHQTVAKFDLCKFWWNFTSNFIKISWNLHQLLKTLLCSAFDSWWYCCIKINFIPSLFITVSSFHVQIYIFLGKEICSHFRKSWYSLSCLFLVSLQLTRHNGQAFTGLPDATMVQNQHAHRIHMPIVQIMKTFKLWSMPGTGHCTCCPFRILAFCTGIPEMPSRYVGRHNGLYQCWPVLRF